MKRTAIIISTFLALNTAIHAQDQFDAFLVSKEMTTGTARSLSMGGSFGALGGDFSVASTNPAGLAVYRSSVFTITPGLNFTTSSSNYSGISNEDYNYKLTLDNLGILWAQNTGKKSGWVGTAFGIGYNRLNDFNQNIILGPVIANSSYVDWITGMADGAYVDEGLPDPAYYDDLFYDADILLYDSLGYFSDFLNSTYGQTQERSINREGRNGEYTFSFAANYSNMLYIGATLGLQRFKYSETVDHFEDDRMDNIPVFSSFRFKEYYNLNGTGANFKFGILVKPIDFLRVGASVQLPTKMKMSSDFSTSLSRVNIYIDGLDNSSFHSDLGISDFKIVKPLRALFSVGFVVGKYGLLNVDYEYIDYTKMRIRSGDDSFYDINNNIKQDFTKTGNLKIGGEVNLGLLALRGGYGYLGDPYSSSGFNTNDPINTYSAGIGVRSKDFSFDIGGTYYVSNENHFLYNVPSTNQNQIASIETNFIKILATFGFKF